MLKRYFSMLRSEFSGYNLKAFSSDLMAGLTVTAVALPLALAFGVSCGADAAAGLITAILAGLVIGALSGASFQISGPTGAMSAVLVTIIAKFGLDGVFAVSFFAAILILLCALFKLGRFVSLIPRPVITGFTSGIALIIALGQIDNFFGTHSVGEDAIAKLGSFLTGKAGTIDWKALVIGLIVVAVMIAWPKKWNARGPSSLVGIIVATVVSTLAGFDIATVGEIPRKLFLESRLSFASIEWARILEYLSPAISIAALAMIESLLCGASASRMKNEPFDADQELVAQGIGNLIIPFFGGVPATAAIARTSVAIKSGAVTRVCGIIHALGLLASMFLLGPIMAKLPLSALAGVLMVTAWRMNEWHDIKTFFRRKNASAIAKFLITMIATVLFDLTVAILIGIGFSCLLFVIKCAHIELTERKSEDGTPVITVTGALFFGNIGKFRKRLGEMTEGKDAFILSLAGVTAIDTTAVSSLEELCGERSVIIDNAIPKIAAQLSKAGLIPSDKH